MRAAPISLFVAVALALSGPFAPSRAAQSPAATGKTSSSFDAKTFEMLRNEGNDALYNLDYAAARDHFVRMTKMAPDHPAGFVSLANNLWLETLNASRRLSTSVYTGGAFYAQEAEEDRVDPKRDREFNNLIKHALTLSKARLEQDPKDVEALYYQAAAVGLRAGYNVTVKRSFRRAIGDANESIQLQKKVIKLDPEYIDAYMSIGLYEYVIDSLPWVWRTLARLAGLTGSKQKGIEHLELVARRGKYVADDAQVLLMGIYSRENKPEKSLEIISSLAGRYPRNYLFGLERAGMLYRMGRADEGARAYADLLKDARTAQAATDLVNYQWGEFLLAKGDYAAALEKYNAAKQWAKAGTEVVSLSHLRAGQSLDALGKRAEAMAEYKIVLKRENVFDSHKLASQYVKTPYVPAKA
jgi:tetratricopeptide (TPR) repeat protein